MQKTGIRHEPSSALKGNETVLVVDDIESVRSLLNNVLRVFGYNVICAEDGMDGLEKFRENKDKINLMLLDIVMPGLNGIELLKEINKTEPNIKALFMSGYNEIFDCDNLQGKIKCISKPFAIETLLKEIRYVLDN